MSLGSGRLTTLALALAVSHCGGQTDDRSGTGGTASGGSAGGATTGGSSAGGTNAGGSSTGGISAGGSAAGGTSAGGSSAGGAATGGSAGQGGASGGGQGGSVGTAGSASGGSAGSGSGGVAGWAACSQPSECVVRPASCCGDCGAATRGDAVAVAANVAANDAYSAIACANGDACDLCYAPQDPLLAATCRAGACAVIDLLELPLTACSSPDDCRVRTSDCCECGGDVSADALIAIRTDGENDFQALVCDPGTGCPECAPQYPDAARAQCLDGRCRVTSASGTTPQPP